MRRAQNILEEMESVPQGLLTGGQTFFLKSPSMSTFFEDIQEVRPTEIVLPPRICTLLYERFNEELDCIVQANGSTDIAELRQVSFWHLPLLMGKVGKLPSADHFPHPGNSTG